MNKYLFILFIVTNILYSSCSNGQNANTSLSPTEFSEKIKELPSAPLIDVRSSGEFAEDHLENAINYNWNDKEFEQQISKLNKTEPVLVYCLSGGRSSAAAKYMRENGFELVYELNGGITDWKAAKFPIVQ